MSETPEPASASEAVGQPVRVAIVRALRDEGELTLDAIASAARVHRNTARSHCAALEAAGAIQRAPAHAHAAPGRPPVRYRLAALEQPSALARLLGGALADSGVSRRKARRLGEIGGAAPARRLSRRQRMRMLQRQLAELGFVAEVEPGAIELSACPCPLVSPDDPALVCSLVAGTIDGALGASGARERVAGGDHDPVARRCSLRLAPG